MFECVHSSVPVRVSDQPQYQGWAVAEASREANADHGKAQESLYTVNSHSRQTLSMSSVCAALCC